jgi:response regulator of citrate/malate metabolism
MKQAVVDYLIMPVRPEKLYEAVRQHAKGHFYKVQSKTEGYESTARA